jgi:hypothetical protein
MMRCDSAVGRLIAALSAALVLVGCAHVRPADPTAAGVDLDDINAKLAGRVVRVRLVDGTDMLAHNVRVSADSVSMQPRMLRDANWWLAPRRALPISEVGSIEVTRRGRGALEGALFGLGIGGVAGVAIGAATSEGSILSAQESVILGGLVFGVLGTGLGLIIGVGVGSKDVYDLRRAPDTTGSASPGE